jgi:hypothetical protein
MNTHHRYAKKILVNINANHSLFHVICPFLGNFTKKENEAYDITILSVLPP